MGLFTVAFPHSGFSSTVPAPHHPPPQRGIGLGMHVVLLRGVNFRYVHWPHLECSGPPKKPLRSHSGLQMNKCRNINSIFNNLVSFRGAKIA